MADRERPPKRVAFAVASATNSVHVQIHSGGSSQESTDSSFTPHSDHPDAGMSGTEDSGDEDGEESVEEAPLARTTVFTQILENTEVAKQELFNVTENRSHTEGWCCISDLAPSKKNGYVQVSIQGHNHLMVMQNLVLAASGYSSAVYDVNVQASHLCDNRRCCTLGHIVPESAKLNNSRKGCRGWVPCPHTACTTPIFICPHSPPCIRYHSAYADMQALIDAHTDGHK